MEIKSLSVIVVFTALIVVFSFIAHGVAWVGHLTIGAILITFLYLAAFKVTGKLGATTIIGALVGLINSFIWGSPIHLLIQLTRGATFDIFFLATGHRLCCRKCAAASSMLSFYATVVVMFSLSVMVGILSPVLWFVFLLIVGPLGAIISILGGLLALKSSRRFKWIS